MDVWIKKILANYNKLRFDNLGFPIYFIHISQLLKAKQASGRFKDLADIEALKKRKHNGKNNIQSKMNSFFII